MTSRSKGEGVTQWVSNTTDRLHECVTKEGIGGGPKKVKNLHDVIYGWPLKTEREANRFLRGGEREREANGRPKAPLLPVLLSPAVQCYEAQLPSLRPHKCVSKVLHDSSTTE